jgi:hypothetical protein
MGTRLKRLLAISEVTKRKNQMLNGSLRGKQLSIHQIIEKSLRTREMSRHEYLQLTSAVLQCQASSNECTQLNQVFDDLRSGRVQLVD